MTMMESILTGNPQDQIYNSFLEQLSKFKEDEWHLVLFEGSPTENAYSWCSDCVYAEEGVRKFKASYGGPVRFLQFKVGSKEEWGSADNPFKVKFPCLTDLPTAMLFRGQIDTMRVIAVQQKDLLHLCERSEEYENQIRSGVWVPPMVKRVELARSQ
jgi:Eukaryotic protein of unknown function (DUF953)